MLRIVPVIKLPKKFAKSLLKPKVLAPQMTWKDMERLWQREEGEPKEEEAEEEETKDED